MYVKTEIIPFALRQTKACNNNNVSPYATNSAINKMAMDCKMLNKKKATGRFEASGPVRFLLFIILYCMGIDITVSKNAVIAMI